MIAAPNAQNARAASMLVDNKACAKPKRATHKIVDSEISGASGKTEKTALIFVFNFELGIVK